MRRYILLPLLVVLAGVPGFWLRRQELAHAFESGTGFFTESAYTPILLWLTVSLGLLLLLSLLRLRFQGTYAAAFESRSPLRLGALVLSAGLMAAAGLLAFGDLFQYISAFGTQSLFSLQKHLLLRAVLGAVSLLCCAASLVMAVRGFRPAPRKGRYSAAVLAPAFLSCIWLLSSYQNWSADPVFLHYAYPLLAIIFCTLSCTSMASFLYEKSRPRITLVTGLLAVFLFFTGAADSTDGMTLLLSLALGIYLLTGMVTLLYRTAHPIREPAEAQPETEEPIHE